MNREVNANYYPAWGPLTQQLVTMLYVTSINPSWSCRSGRDTLGPHWDSVGTLLAPHGTPHSPLITGHLLFLRRSNVTFPCIFLEKICPLGPHFCPHSVGAGVGNTPQISQQLHCLQSKVGLRLRKGAYKNGHLNVYARTCNPNSVGTYGTSKGTSCVRRCSLQAFKLSQNSWFSHGSLGLGLTGFLAMRGT